MSDLRVSDFTLAGRNVIASVLFSLSKSLFVVNHCLNSRALVEQEFMCGQPLSQFARTFVDTTECISVLGLWTFSITLNVVCVYSALNGPEDWILRYIRTCLFAFLHGN